MRIGPALVASVLALLALGAALTLAPASSGGGQWDDTGPEGHSQLAQALARETHVRALEGSLALIPRDAGDGDALLVFAAGRPIGEAEAEAVAAFVERGGTLVLASDTPGLGPLSRVLGVSLHGVAAVREQGEGCVEADIPMPGAHVLVCLPSPSAFPDATLDAAGVNFSFVAHSAQPIFFDLDGNGILDLQDQAPTHAPVALGWRHGRGEVIAIADADLWRNQALVDTPSNTVLAAALADGAGTVYMDSTGGEANQAQRVRSAWLDAAASEPGRSWPTAAAAVGAATLVAVLPRLTPWRPHRPDPEGSDPAVAQQAQEILRGALRGRPDPIETIHQGDK